MSIIDRIDKHGHGATSVNIAARYRDKAITYGQLAEQSDAVASYLAERFGKDRTPVIVYGHKQVEMLICFLACVKSGHSYIPVDSSIPYNRLITIADSSSAKIIFTLEEPEGKLENLTKVNGSQLEEIARQYLGRKPSGDFRVGPDDVFYVIYTSGSTGTPKGVQITLSCLENFVAWGMKLCRLKQGRQYVFMNQAPYSFDLSVMDLYLSLVSGSTLFCLDKKMISNMQELFSYFKQSNINVWVSTPSFAEMCLSDSSYNENLLPGLETMLFCGETLSNHCVERLYERFQNARVINLYGPTEATVAVTAVEITRDMCKEQKPLPVGYAMDNCRVVIEKDGLEVPEGEKGEVIIEGDSVSIGYCRNKELTERAFSTAIVNGAEKRRYKTGDEGYMKDGLLYFCGRIDFQLKLNGYRIELDDIEVNLRNLSMVKNAVVLPVERNGKVKYLAAFVVLEHAAACGELEIASLIRKELREFLPEYMIPRAIFTKNELPMTPNGKTNRKLLLEELT